MLMGRRYLPGITVGLVDAAASKLDQRLTTLRRSNRSHVALRALERLGGTAFRALESLAGALRGDDDPSPVPVSHAGANDDVARRLQQINDELRHMTTPQLFEYATERTAAQTTGSTELAQRKLDAIDEILRDGSPDEMYQARRDLELFCKREMMRQRGVDSG